MNIIVTYPGRFQPFHKGHYSIYQRLVDKFGVNNIYVCTSNVTNNNNSPFNFKEKKQIITSLFNVKKSKIIQVKNTYAPIEVTNNFNEKQDVFITVVSQKDSNRLNNGKYFEKFRNIDQCESFGKKGYYIVLDITENISATEIRSYFSSNKSISEKKEYFKKIYNKFDDNIFKLFMNKLNRKNESTLNKMDQKIINSSELVKYPKYVKQSFNFFLRNSLQFLKENINESEASDKAHKMGLTSKPGGKWYDKSDNYVAKTEDGKLKKIKNNKMNAEDALHNERIKEKRDKADKLINKNLESIIFDFTAGGYSVTGYRFSSLIRKAFHPEMQSDYRLDKVKKLCQDKQFKQIGDRIFGNEEDAKRFCEDIYKKIDFSDEDINNIKEYVQQQQDILRDTGLVEKDENGNEFIKLYRGIGQENEEIQKGEKNFIGSPADSWTIYPDIAAAHSGGENIVYAKVPLKNILMSFIGSKLVPFVHEREVTVDSSQGIKAFIGNKKEIEQASNLKESQKELPVYNANNFKDIDWIAIGKMKNKYKKKNINENLLKEGGAYGHMSNVYEDFELTFGDLKNIINLGLEGGLQYTQVKIDGQNLLITWKDGKLKAARNKSHIKNYAKDALDIKGLTNMFSGRGEIQNAFVFAMNDLSTAIGALTDKQKFKIFGKGNKFINLEIIYPGTQNIIPYGMSMLLLHGSVEYDENGNQMSNMDKEAGRILAGMIKQINNNIQQTFCINNTPNVKLKNDLSSLKPKFLSQLDTLQNKYKLSDGDKIIQYHEKWWEDYINSEIKKKKLSLSNPAIELLIKRWTYGDKKTNIKSIVSMLRDKEKEWIYDIDKNNYESIFKNNIRPFEILFGQLGVAILKNIDSNFVLNPKSAVTSIKNELKKAIKDIKSTNDPSKLSFLKNQLEMLQAKGGLNSIAADEGIVFVYNGKVMKLTGTFSNVNQIIGALKYGR